METKESLEEVKKELRENHFSELTLLNYCFFIEKFLLHCNKSLDAIAADDVQSYISSLQASKSSSTISLATASLKFLFSQVLKKDFPSLQFPKKEKTASSFLVKEEVKKMIESADTKKSKLMISLLYATGLKVSELVNLKPGDLNLEQKTGTVRKALGGAHTVSLSQRLSEEIKEYLEGYKGLYLFSLHQPLTTRNIQKIVKTTAKRAGIEKKITPHTLRSSFAKHLLESGIDERVIAKIMGYAKKNNQFDLQFQDQLLKVKNPHDSLE